MEIVYFKRKKNLQYSIERVFNTVQENMPKDVTSLNVQMNYHRARPISLILNMYKTFISRGELNHIVGDIHYVSLVLPRKNTILTIHDTIDVDTSRGIKRFFSWLIWYYLPIMKIKYITCISQNTKNQIIKITKCNPQKIFVIHNPVDPRFVKIERIFNSEMPTILHIGTKDNKNLERVISALDNKQCHLRIIGRLTKSQQTLLDNTSIKYSNVYDLSDEEIFHEYVNADIISFPTLYEGFGMIVIEAQAVGRVVLTSKIQPLIEVAVDSVHYVDPYDIDSIRSGFEVLINDSNYRNSLIEKGYINVKRFDARKISQEYYNLYRFILNEM